MELFKDLSLDLSHTQDKEGEKTEAKGYLNP